MSGRTNLHLEEMPPAAVTLGREILAIDADSGVVRLRFVARPEFGNRHGTVGGGFLAAMLDSSAAAAVLSTLPEERTAVTTELHVSFLRPASPGEIRGVGRALSSSERDAESEAEISLPDGTVVARATAKFRIVARR